jgi:hypothetical protein
MTAHAFPADPTLEALRVQRDAYAASGGQAAVIYEEGRNSGGSRKLRDHSLAFRFEMSLTGGIAGNFPTRLYPRRVSFTVLEPTDGARAKKG